MGAKGHLRRSKSTRSVRTSHNTSPAAESIDPEIARLYARLAASKAMSRSREGSSGLSEGSYDCLGGPRNMAVPPRRYKRTESSYSSERSTSAYDDLTQDHDQAWPAALPSISEFAGFENRIAELPSSYRRLRKSRSMFSTRQRSSHRPSRPPPSESYSPSIASQGPRSEAPRLYRSLRRSISSLRGDNQPQNALRHAKSHDVAIQLARSQYEQNLLNSPDSPHWTPLPISKIRREHKPFPKSFRTSSASERVSATSSPLERVKASESHGKARAFSSSIKKSIKRVLGFSRNSAEHGKAQVSPSPTHRWGQSPSTVNGNENEYPYSQERFDVDRLHEPVSGNPPPSVRRMQSSASLATSRSRVTSWADSTAANTIATPKAGGQQRLSIISEQGNKGQSELLPLSESSIGRGPSSNAVDSHRLFSALMKRISGANAQSPNEKLVLGHVKEHRAIPTQGSSHFHRSRHTIRQVPSDASINSPKSFTTANVNPMTPYEQAQIHGPAHGCNTYSVSKLQDDSKLRADTYSPSVYSRSTSGNSPQTKTITESPDSDTGIATIYASERTAYSSPSKVAQSPLGDAPTAGTDWQNFMDTQIARIESTTPPQHHYREDAEIQDEDDTSFTSAVPARRIRVESRGTSQVPDDGGGLNRKVSTNSNFSRPFSRSLSLRTVVKVQEPSPNALPTSMPIGMGDDVFRDSGRQESALKSARAGQSEVGVSPMLSRSSNKPRIVESPTPKRYAADISPKMSSKKYGQNLTKWSPGSQEARSLQKRRSAHFQRDNRKATNENIKLEPGLYDRPYGLQSPMSSKRMVEIFLNSRRRQMGADLSDDGTPEPAFL
ncbi:uncharacterized protein BJX67DRAFT_198557 [Aspergillus lucknowensis]|uniref:Uncharacterized protein n=1 Tax=Aspergillus lucknowensis TaxID=176173 RepID=A0ABR4LMW8_9EURO